MNANRLARTMLAASGFLALAACGSTSMPSLWPFGEKESGERDRRPANAVEYRCDQNKSFYVRRLDENTVWLIAPDREIRLARIGGNGSQRYGVGRTELDIQGATATLADPPAQFAGCKRVEGK